MTGTSLSWQAFLGFNLRNLLKIVSLIIKLNEKDIFLFFNFSFILMILGWFSYFFIAFKTGSELLRFFVISTKLLSTWIFWVMLLKNVLKVWASFGLFVIVLLLSSAQLFLYKMLSLKIGDLLLARIFCCQKQPFYLIA